jgi:uncharacterized protein (DUF1919 family)
MKMRGLKLLQKEYMKCITYQKYYLSQVLVVHTCNPTYSGGGDQEDHGMKPAWGKSS